MSQAPSLRAGVRQLLDWRAAIWAGLIAGAVLLIVLLVGYPLFTGGSPVIVLRYISSLLLGDEVLLPGEGSDAAVVVVALIVHFVLSVLFTLLLAFIIYRWELVIGILGGALYGLALYAINFFLLTNVFDWFAPARSLPFALALVLYGAVAGGVYELLEDEVYVPAENRPELGH
ncbi:MAG: hypothetical protein ACRDHL_02920 [Candidatus Promineifilaceae bacterium]